VIVSHKYRFIFIKTHKVAGTSIEFALTRFAGEDGIVTPFSVRIDERERERSGFGVARNYKTGAGEYRAHIPAEEVRNLLGRETFGRYFKFSVERNPYDKVVSLYTWLNRDPKRPLGQSFDDFVAEGRARQVADFDRYCIDGKPAMDAMVLYDDLQAGLDGIAAHLGLPERIDLTDIRRKSGFRKSQDYRTYYAPASRAAVERDFAREIAQFGFKF
jgi:hypothetical protein